MNIKPNSLKKTALSALFLALGSVLPLLTAQVKEIGDTLLPMHIPVLLCGLICGGGYGFAVGLILPPFRSLIFGMPPLYPNSVWMAAELAVYGLISGVIYSKCKTKNTAAVYFAIIPAMLAGRVVWGVLKRFLLGLSGKGFTFSMFVAGGFIDAFPGIILQLILIPFIMKLINLNSLKSDNSAITDKP